MRTINFVQKLWLSRNVKKHIFFSETQRDCDKIKIHLVASNLNFHLRKDAIQHMKIIIIYEIGGKSSRLIPISAIYQYPSKSPCSSAFIRKLFKSIINDKSTLNDYTLSQNRCIRYFQKKNMM